MKKLSIMLLTMLIAFSCLLGCGNNETPDTSAGLGMQLVVTSINDNDESDTNVYDLKEGIEFTISVMNTDYKFEIASVTNDKVIIRANDYGFVKPNEDGSMNLRAKENEFELSVNEELKLCYQATDVSSCICFNVKK